MPRDRKGLSFLDCMADMLSDPMDVETRFRPHRTPEDGLQEDADNIRGYFDRALGKLGLKEMNDGRHDRTD